MFFIGLDPRARSLADHGCRCGAYGYYPVVLPQDILAEINTLQHQLRDIRHDIHRHPELGFEEIRTQAKVRAWLTEYGYAPTDCAKTGLIADLHQDRTDAPFIGLRADLDALPMTETTDLPYRSVHVGNAHKCGHDGHTTILMGVAAILAKHKARVPSNVRLLFQPAEEGQAGGDVMVKEGALSGVDEVYGLHNWPLMPKGLVMVKSGAMMAQVHTLKIRVQGIGGHGSQPQSCRDPIVAASQLVVALQTVVARGLGYEGGAVVSVCAFQSGNTHNVIPAEANLQGTVRTFDPKVADRVIERIREIGRGVAVTFGVEVEVDIEEGYPVVDNHPDCAAAVQRVAEQVVGADRLSEEGLPIAGGEDFAYMCRAVPGAYFLLGAGKPGERTPSCHHPDFDFDDDLIPLGMKMFLGIVWDYAERQGRSG